jgi:hypothetical protein
MSSGNHLTVQRTQTTEGDIPEDEEWGHSFVCRTCPYEFVVNKEFYNRRMSRVKRVDDIMGGASAWENVDQTTGMHVLFARGTDSSAHVSEQAVWVDQGVLSTDADSQCRRADDDVLQVC